jgi:hypothetical protein
MGIFGDVTQAIAVSIAYSNSLAQEKVLSFANIGAAQSHYTHGSPYLYNLIPTAEDEGGWASGLVCQRMWQMPAIYAGDATYKKTKRAIGLVGGDGPNYVAVGNTAEARMKKACGATVKKRVNYTIDISTYQQQAPSIIAQMKTAGVTTVMCLPCDYVMLQALYNQADGQQYYPEWVILNAGIAGARVLSQRQMAHTLATDDFYFTSGVPRQKSEAYRAFKIASPKTEPAEYGYSQPYYTLMRVFAAIQAAGPNLTPATLQRAWFSLPTSSPGGDAGTWLSGKDRFAPKVDSTVGLWKPDGTSYYDGRQGAYTFCDKGRHYSFTDESAWGPRRQLSC